MKRFLLFFVDPYPVFFGILLVACLLPGLADEFPRVAGALDAAAEAAYPHPGGDLDDRQLRDAPGDDARGAPERSAQ